MITENLTSTVLLNYLRSIPNAPVDVSTIESTLKKFDATKFVPYEEWEQRPEVQVLFDSLLIENAFDEGSYPMVNRLAAFLYIKATYDKLAIEISHMLLEESSFMRPKRLNRIIDKAKVYEPDYYVNLIFSRRVRVEGCVAGAEPTVRDLTLSVLNDSELPGIAAEDVIDKLNEIGIKIVRVGGVNVIAVYLRSEKVRAMLKSSGLSPQKYRSIVTAFGGIDVLSYPIRIGLTSRRVITIDPSWIFDREIKVTENV